MWGGLSSSRDIADAFDQRPGQQQLEEDAMTYETLIEIEIAGIRRGLRLDFEYGVELVEGEMQPVHEGVSVLINGQRLPGKWVYQAIGPRQFKALDARLVKHWKSQTAGTADGESR